ncbi:MAG: DNA-directed RNA polymerase subunit alpha [Candidatus Komeilibacteria bacterium]|nr:DNA-directed RNA polymerase subunit alpha [Candidatus Komeilibacteria bacterium]
MSIALPTTFNLKEAKDNRATVIIEPCYPGYGVTLGNALRRVLLSSINGAAIVAFKVKGTQHEFSALPHIKEDVVEIMLNLKKLRLKVFSNEPIILNLNVKGEKVVIAGDIQKNAQVEIANPNAVIATLTDKNAVLEMELIAQAGMGYVTVEERAKEKVDLGTIMIDALYSPVVKVGFEIENVRVGQRTDFDRLILKIETDGTISPSVAIAQAAEILNSHFQFILNAGQGEAGVAPKAGAAEEVSVVEPKASKKKEKETADSSSKALAKEEEKPKAVKRGRPKKS